MVHESGYVGEGTGHIVRQIAKTVGMTLYIFVCGNACRRKQGQRDHIAAVAATAALKIELHRVIFSGFPTYFE